MKTRTKKAHLTRIEINGETYLVSWDPKGQELVIRRRYAHADTRLPIAQLANLLQRQPQLFL
jgi:hypothetical protein